VNILREYCMWAYNVCFRSQSISSEHACTLNIVRSISTLDLVDPQDAPWCRQSIQRRPSSPPLASCEHPFPSQNPRACPRSPRPERKPGVQPHTRCSLHYPNVHTLPVLLSLVASAVLSLCHTAFILRQSRKTEITHATTQGTVLEHVDFGAALFYPRGAHRCKS